ncbi:MAG TPA: tetratricopeptide repeat protein [Gemmataceae bacterium]|nr:tetratricopeptide repeat protein [Gemmataceae bacterium]
MRRGLWIAGLLAALAGCADTAQERARDYNEVGVRFYQGGNYRAAADSFQAALALTPEDAALLYNLGQCYDRLGDPAGAEKHYRACLARVPNHPQCHHALTMLLVREGRWPDAVRFTEDWLRREPKRAAALAEDGWLWRQAGDLPRAQSRFQEALSIDPHDPLALAELATIYEARGRPGRALVLYEKLLASNPNQPDVIRQVNRLRAQNVGPPRPE